MSQESAEPSPRPAVVLLRRLVGVLAIACFVWVLRPLVADLGELRDRVSPLHLAAAIAVCGVLYAGLYLFVVAPWRLLIGAFEAPPSLRDAWWCIGRSQWAKYLPSNTMHLVGRQILGRRLGLRQSTLATASVLEHASLAGAALALLLLFGRSADWAGALPVPLPLLALLVVGGLLLWPLGVELLARLGLPERVQRHLPRVGLATNASTLVRTIPAHALLFIGSAGIVTLLLQAGWHGTAAPDAFSTMLWVVPAGWLVGTLAPGAPGGLGVREAIFFIGLEPLLGAADASGLALAFRAVTVLGDAIVALSAWRLALR